MGDIYLLSMANRLFFGFLFQIIDAYRDDKCWITQTDGFIQFWENKRATFLRRQDELAVRIHGCKDRLRN